MRFRDIHINQYRILTRAGILGMCIFLVIGCVASPSPTQSSIDIPASPGVSTGQSTPTLPPTPLSSPEPSQAHSIPTVSPEPAPSPSSPPPSPSQPVPAQYDLEASLDYYAHTLSVSEIISYTNITTATIPDLVLDVESNYWPGSFNLANLSWQNGQAIDDYQLKESRLQIPLIQPLQPGDQLGLKIVYQLALPEIPPPTDVTRPVPYGYTERQTNIVDWYPYIPPYQPGTGWLVHSKWWFGEHQVFEPADFHVRFSLAEPVQDLVIAASAPAEQNGSGYDYHLASARSFALSASIQYLVQSTQVGNITVYAYSFPYDKAGGEQVLKDTASALELYSQLFIPYPHKTLSVVEADFLDGMEYDGLYFLSRGFYNLYDGTPQGYLTFIAAHETAHQWWYALVGNDQALEPWLDESLCTYMEHVFYEYVYADYQTTASGSIVDWWWYYRVNFYEPSGWINGSIYDYSQFRPYRDSVYLNGAKFMQDLRTLIGDNAFFAFLKDYAIQENGRISTTGDFFTVLRSHTSKDISDLVSKYFKPGQ